MDLKELLAQYEEIHKSAKKFEVVIPPVEVSKVFDDAPEDLINLDYTDLVNMYKKIQKVIEIKQKFQTYEVPERRVSIESTEKPKVETVEETPIVRPPPPPVKPPEHIILKEEEKKLKVAVPYVDSHEEVVIEIPNQLSVPVDEAARKKIEAIVQRHQQAGEINKSDLKRKMVELTRELFKEKSAERKAELKAQIVELKKIIEQKEAERKGEGIFEAVVKEQEEDMNEIISGLLATFNTNFDKVNNEYQQAKLVIFDDPEMSAKADSLFSSDLDSILTQITKIINLYSDYIIKVHVAELEHLKGFGGVSADNIDKRIEYVRLNYPSKFDELKIQISSIISKAKPKASPEPSPPVKEEKALAPPPEKPQPYTPTPPLREEKKVPADEIKSILDEINMMHEGELLHYLSSRDRRFFVSYVRGEISKEDAVKQAKILLAKERGVSDTLIKTYWS